MTSMESPLANVDSGSVTPRPGTTDTVGRVDANLEYLDRLWAELDRGEFDPFPDEKPPPATNPKRPERRRRSARKAQPLTDYTVSIVIPVYNECQTIRQVIERVVQLSLRGEILVVDDGSTDGTRECLAALADVPNLRVICKDTNQGKGAALQTAFATASGDIVIVQDADLEYDPQDIPNVLRPIVLGQADVVYGSRYLHGRGQDLSTLHRLGNWLLTALSNQLNGVQLTDMETCYKAFRKEVLQGLTLQQPRFGFEPEITAKVARRQFRIQEVPIGYRPRGYAEGKKIGIKDLFSTLYCIARYSWSD